MSSRRAKNGCFDVTSVQGSAFAPLREAEVQQTVAVVHGFVSWLDGAVDLASEHVYEHSLVYNAVPDDLLVG